MVRIASERKFCRQKSFFTEVVAPLDEQKAISREFDGLRTSRYFDWQPKPWAQRHNYTLQVTVTDPKWIAHLENGLEYETTAYDAWSEAG